MKKTFVLDTNVLLHSARSMESFQDNDVVIPMAVIEELDKFKKNQDELGRNARQVIRRLDRLREAGNLQRGVPLTREDSMATGKLFVLAAAMLEGPESEAEMNQIFRHSQISSPRASLRSFTSRLSASGRGPVCRAFASRSS